MNTLELTNLLMLHGKMGKWENILFRDCTAHTSDVFSSSLSLSLCNLFFFLF